MAAGFDFAALFWPQIVSLPRTNHPEMTVTSCLNPIDLAADTTAVTVTANNASAAAGLLAG